jgi:hemerythrin-like metal-binding protein
MPSYEWSKRYKVDIKEMDEQHRKLFELINRLEEKAIAEKSEEAFNSVILELIRYTQVHFGHEETLMRRFKYPRFAEHLDAHNRFVKDVSGYIDESRTDRIATAQRLLSFLGDWIVNHIGTMDRKLAPFLRERMEDV